MHEINDPIVLRAYFSIPHHANILIQFESIFIKLEITHSSHCVKKFLWSNDQHWKYLASKRLPVSKQIPIIHLHAALFSDEVTRSSLALTINWTLIFTIIVWFYSARLCADSFTLLFDKHYNEWKTRFRLFFGFWCQTANKSNKKQNQRFFSFILLWTESIPTNFIELNKCTNIACDFNFIRNFPLFLKNIYTSIRTSWHGYLDGT